MIEKVIFINNIFIIEKVGARETQLKNNFWSWPVRRRAHLIEIKKITVLRSVKLWQFTIIIFFLQYNGVRIFFKFVVIDSYYTYGKNIYLKILGGTRGVIFY